MNFCGWYSVLTQNCTQRTVDFYFACDSVPDTKQENTSSNLSLRQLWCPSDKELENSEFAGVQIFDGLYNYLNLADL